MCVAGTLVEHYPHWGLYVKREDLCCPSGPHFSKTRGVYAHIAKCPERIIGCLDTGHSQGGWATAQACSRLGKQAVVYYPLYKKARPLPEQQKKAAQAGADLRGLPAGRSAVLYHAAKKDLVNYGPYTYMMPNALKLPEMIEETVAEVLRTPLPPVGVVIISASSGTIAAGVISGLCQVGYRGRIVVHQGYSRGEGAVRNYMSKMVAEYSNEMVRELRHPGFDYDGDSGGVWSRERNFQLWREDYELVDEGYSYGDPARSGPDPEWPCNKFYDLKAFRWWVWNQKNYPGEALLWNIG